MRLDFSPYRGRRVWPRRWQQHVCRTVGASTRETEVGIFNMATVHTSCTTVHQCASSEHARFNDSLLSYFLPSPLNPIFFFLLPFRLLLLLLPLPPLSPLSLSLSSPSSSLADCEILPSSDNFFISEMKLFVSLEEYIGHR